jgi:hypothetical protein
VLHDCLYQRCMYPSWQPDCHGQTVQLTSHDLCAAHTFMHSTSVHLTKEDQRDSAGSPLCHVVVCRFFGGDCYTLTCSLTTRVALPTEIGTDGQRPLLITKGNPTSSRGCYQVVPVEHHLYQVVVLRLQSCLSSWTCLSPPPSSHMAAH